MTKARSKARSKAATKPATKPAADRPSGERVEVAIAARIPAPTDAERSAFRKQFSEAECEARGKRTSAVGVLGDVRKWLAIIERNLALDGARIRYSQARFAWLLENVAALAQQDHGRKAGASASGRLDIATSRARAARVELSRALARIATGDPEAESNVAAARGDTTTPQAVLDSLRALMASARGWLDKRDAESVALCESVHLSQADLDAGSVAADALAAALGTKIATGVERADDGPDTNRIEGRVTYEMAVAKAAFDQAADLAIGERLTPGPATRALFSSGSKKKPAPAAAASGASSGNGAPVGA